MMRKHIVFLLCTLPLAYALTLSSCNKENFTDDASVRLTFSTDTILFDTVFTTMGSTTRRMKIYNTEDDYVMISEISLRRGENSPYSINVDGVAGKMIHDIEMAPHDSIFLFAKVRIDPTNSNSPLIEEDDVFFKINGNTQNVKLLAWGQDAHYIIAKDTLSYNPDYGATKYCIVAHEHEVIRWTPDKPYVIVGGFAAVDSLGILEIMAGTQVYLDNRSGIWVYPHGNIKVLGEADNEVVFQSIHKDDYYEGKTGLWDRIWINESPYRHVIENAIIKDGFIGIQAENLYFREFYEHNLVLRNVKIENMSGYGLYASFFSIDVGNVLIDNCGNNLMYLTGGGYYDVRHCTMANFWNKSGRDAEAVRIENYLNVYGEGRVPAPINDYNFENCIVYGSKENELSIDKIESAPMNCMFYNCLLKVNGENALNYNNYFTNCIVNKSPLFADSSQANFHLDTIVSPAYLSGRNETLNFYIDIAKDLDGVSRTINDKPDIGVYQFVND